MFQFTLAASKTPGDFPQRVGSSRVAEEHGHELAPAGKAAGMAFGFGLFDNFLEFIAWKEL
jgi:hypothetical protein